MAFIRKLPSGRYQAVWRDPDRKQRAKSFTRKIDAQQWLTAVDAEMLRGAYVSPQLGREPFRSYAERWVREHPTLRTSTRLLYQRNLSRHVYPVLGERSLSAIRRSDVEALIRRAGETLGPKSVHNIHRLVAAVFNHAVFDGVLARSPARGARLPSIPRRPIVPLSREQVWRLAEVIEPRYRCLLLLMAATGLRQGEALGLTVQNVDFLRRELHVHQQLVDLPRIPRHLGPPKTTASVRTIPLPDFVLAELARHMRVYPQGPWGLIFTSRKNQPIPRASWHRAWTKAIQRGGLPAGTTVHMLRHTYASILIEQGLSVKTVQARLGHANALETLNTYAHLWPEADDQTRRSINDALARADDPLTADDSATP